MSTPSMLSFFSFTWAWFTLGQVHPPELDGRVHPAVCLVWHEFTCCCIRLRTRPFRGQSATKRDHNHYWSLLPAVLVCKQQTVAVVPVNWDMWLRRMLWYLSLLIYCWRLLRGCQIMLCAAMLQWLWVLPPLVVPPSIVVAPTWRRVFSSIQNCVLRQPSTNFWIFS